jgi:hypothetical protein
MPPLLSIAYMRLGCNATHCYVTHFASSSQSSAHLFSKKDFPVRVAEQSKTFKVAKAQSLSAPQLSSRKT